MTAIYSTSNQAAVATTTSASNNQPASHRMPLKLPSQPSQPTFVSSVCVSMPVCRRNDLGNGGAVKNMLRALKGDALLVCHPHRMTQGRSSKHHGPNRPPRELPGEGTAHPSAKTVTGRPSPVCTTLQVEGTLS